MRISSLFVCLLWVQAWAATPAEFTLVERGKDLVSIVHGRGDEYAAQKLAAEFRKYTESVPVLTSSQAASSGYPVCIYVGTPQSNPALAAAVSNLGWLPEVKKLPAEGYLIRTGTYRGARVIVLAGETARVLSMPPVTSRTSISSKAVLP